VPLPVPVIGEGDCKKLLDEAIRRGPVHNLEWTDFNQSDPGITLVELLAFLVDTLLWLVDERERQRRRYRRRRIALLVVGTAGLGAAWLRR